MAILSYVHEIQAVYNVVHNPQMILLSEKGAHGVSSRCEKVGTLLPQRSYGSMTLPCNEAFKFVSSPQKFQSLWLEYVHPTKRNKSCLLEKIKLGKKSVLNDLLSADISSQWDYWRSCSQGMHDCHVTCTQAIIYGSFLHHGWNMFLLIWTQH